MKKFIEANAVSLVVGLTVLLLIPAAYIVKLIIICICIIAYCIYRIIQAFAWEHNTKRLKAFYAAENLKAARKEKFFKTCKVINENL